MPRLKRSDKRKYEVTIDLLNVLANMHVGSAARECWERFWGGAVDGQAAFEALRQTTRGINRRRVLGAADGETYEAWLERLATEARGRWPEDAGTEDDDGDDEPDPDEDAAPWRR